jgi:hypothetical protein
MVGLADSAAPYAPAILWQDEVRYDLLLQIPEVRERIAAATASAKKRLTGEEFLELAEKALEPLLHGVPVSKVAALVQPLYARLGIGTSKSRSETLPTRAGETIIAAVCSLAAAGMAIKQAQQAEDGCILLAEIPSDWRSFAGELAVAIHRQAGGTHVEALAKIGGQLYDWGKNQQALERLFRDLRLVRIAA